MNKDILPEIGADRIACQQILEADHSVFSVQWVVISGLTPGTISSVNLLERYLSYIRLCTAGIIQPLQTSSGIEFRLLASSLSLMQFLPPRIVIETTESRTTLNISGGLLVSRQECDRGQLEFLVEECGGGCRIALKLSDYCPLILGNASPSLWRKQLYRFTQAYIHKVVTINFLAMICRKITGKAVQPGVIKTVVRDGHNI